MNRLLLLLLLFGISGNCQTLNCELEDGSFYYLRFKIQPENNYSIWMAGICENFNATDLNINDLQSFISDFYSKCFYMPELELSVYRELIRNCVKGYIKDPEDEDKGVKIAIKLDEKSRKIELKLKTGEYLTIYITKVTGSFWSFYKEKNSHMRNSSELNIYEIPEINKCYIPFEIKKYNKPRKKDIMY